MQRVWSLSIFILLIGMSACNGGPYSSTSSFLKIIAKDYSKDYKETWIIAYDPNNQTKQQKIKIMVEEPMVWNLIEVIKTYFTSYSKVGNNPWDFRAIAHPDDNNSLR
jgi:hypothetical protein